MNVSIFFDVKDCLVTNRKRKKMAICVNSIIYMHPSNCHIYYSLFSWETFLISISSLWINIGIWAAHLMISQIPKPYSLNFHDFLSKLKLVLFYICCCCFFNCRKDWKNQEFRILFKFVKTCGEQLNVVWFLNAISTVWEI